MARFTLRHFSHIETLRAIAPAMLLAFFKPFQAFFQVRGLTLPRSGSGLPIDYRGLALILMTPDATTPKELIDALYFANEMSTTEAMDHLLAEMQKRNLKIPAGRPTPEEVAIKTWLVDKDILERMHAEHAAKNCLAKVRSFATYRAGLSSIPRFKRPSEKQLQVLAGNLDGWFDQKNRGRGSRVLMFRKNDGIWFLVRHGEPCKREESLEGSKTSSVFYRPLKYDMVIYRPEIGEPCIHASSKGEKELYRTEFGRHLFGSEDFFPGTEKYTLEPLREHGPAALNCVDNEGIEWITLKEVQLYRPGQPWEIVTRKSDDLFALMEARNTSIPSSSTITRASFLIKFADAKTPRTVVIRPSNIAQFIRDDDAAFVEAWLSARGFIVAADCDESEAEEADEILARE